MKALFAELTSVNFTARLQGLQSRQGTSSAKVTLRPNLGKYSNITMTSETVRNDLTNAQQYRLTQRIISSKKVKEICTIASGRGRKLKHNEFPELGIALESLQTPTLELYQIRERRHTQIKDTQRGGGGLEAHPRVTTGTLYRGVDSVTTMKQAREILLSMAPEGFNISLSACYNYYRQGSAQARGTILEKTLMLKEATKNRGTRSCC